MAETLRKKGAGWVEENWDNVLDIACFWPAALLGEWFLMRSELPGRAILCALLIADAVPDGARPAAPARRRSFLGTTPYHWVVAVAIGVLWHFAFQLPNSSLGVIPIWFALVGLRRFAFPYLWPRLAVFDRRHPASHARGVFLETCALGFGYYLASSFVPVFWPNRSLPIFMIVAWPAWRLLSMRLRPTDSPTSEWLRLLLGYAFFAAVLTGILARAGSQLSLAHAVFLLWCLGAVAVARIAWRVLVAWRPKPEAEGFRWIVVAVVGFWLMRGYASYDVKGAGDSRWYGMMLADMLAQVHAGVFPVWLGQSVTQFNGAIYPLRIAPGFHYLGAFLDLLTLRVLGVFALQNLLLTLAGIGALFCCYFSLAVMLPARRWLSAGLAILLLSCPGVLGMVYKNDLIMSWVTLPWVVLAWYATVQSFSDRGGCRTMALLGASLGLCWWGHSPIALWSTLVAAGIQVVRITTTSPSRSAGLAAFAGIAAFLAIAAYPIGSVLFFPPEAGLKIGAFQQATASSIIYFVREVFPGVLRPLSPGAHDLSDLQLGYSLWAILVFCLCTCRGLRLRSAGAALGAALILVLLLIPVPGLNAVLWNVLPQFVRNATSNWAMNRLYLPLACAVIFGAASMISAGVLARRRLEQTLIFIVGAGCVWSLAESSEFNRDRYDPSVPPGSSVDLTRPENAVLTRFAYFIFPRPPNVFTHGVTDPAIESRLWSADTRALTASNYQAARDLAHLIVAGNFVAPAPATALFLQFDRPLRIEPKHRYLLDFDFPQGANTRGVIEMTGKTFHREYGLPDFGGSQSFGAGGEHNSMVPVSTSSTDPVDLDLRFYPEHAAPTNSGIRARLLEYDPSALPVQLDSLIPYRVRVKAPAAGWLETPRMHQVGYVAAANGRPAAVRRSPDGLAWIAVPAGESRVELDFKPPVGLQMLFWVSLVSIGFAAGTALAGGARLVRAFSG